MKTIKVKNEEYEVIPPLVNAASKIISDMYIRLGRPETPLSESGKKMMNIIIAIWQDLYPKEAREWLAERSEYQKNEMTTREQVSKRTGRSLASYPYPIYKLMKKVFPNFNPAERNNCMKMVKEWPMFKFANRV